MNRRTFIRRSGRSLLLAGAATALASCDFFGADESAPRTLSYDFEGSGTGWSSRWLNVRYAGRLEREGGHGIAYVDPAPGHGVDEESRQTEYMAQPIVLRSVEFSDVEVSVSVVTEGFVEAGLIACWEHDRAYALLIRPPEVYLVR